MIIVFSDICSDNYIAQIFVAIKQPGFEVVNNKIGL